MKALLFALSLPLSATLITPAPSGFVLDGKVADWDQFPPAVTLGNNDTRDAYKLWLGRTQQGIVIAGRITDRAFIFATNPAELAFRAGVDVRLSLADPFELPPITYTREACQAVPTVTAQIRDACLAWVDREIRFRDNITKQFTRRWRITPRFAQESYALPAFDAMTPEEHQVLKFKRPDALPLRAFHADPDGTIGFEILIPWESMPPANRLSLDRVGLKVTLSGTHFGLTTTTFTDPNAEPSEEELPLLAVAPPITTRLTPCEQPLFVRDAYGLDQPAFYFLNRLLETNEVFLFEPPARIWIEPLPSDSHFSLTTHTHVFFSQELDKGEILCGPFMSYRKGPLLKQFPFRLEPRRDEFSLKPVRQFPVKHLADGTRLIRYGPDNSLGRLWRHAWTVYFMRIYALTPRLEAHLVLDYYLMYDDPHEFQIEMSDDWATVTAFFETNGQWTSDSYCLKGLEYRPCGKNRNAQPPKRGLIQKE